MRPRDARLVPVAAATWLAAGVAAFLPAASPWIALGLWGTAFGAAGIGVLRARRSVVIALIVVSAALSAGAASHVALAQSSRSSVGTLAIGGGRAVSVTATVVGKAEATRAGDVSFDAQAHSILVGTRTTALDVPVLVRSAPGVRPDIGAEVRIDGTVQVADPGERAVLIVRAGRSLTVLRPPGGALAVTAELRHRLLAATRGLPEPGAGLIAGLAVGDTSAVGADLDEAMKASSLSHLTAVSGANCALVVGLAFAAAAACRARRGIRVASGLVSLAGFVALVTPEPSVVRAAAMAAIAMLGVLLGRRGVGISLLCVAICAVLIADPWLASSLGFALSVAATGALLVLARPLAEGLARWMPRAIALGLSVPLAAQLACGPLLVLITPTVSVYGVAANLLAAPAAPIATVVGLAACLAAPLPVLQSGLAAVTWLPAQWIAVTAEIARALPANAIAWPEGFGGMVLLGLVGAATTVVVAGFGQGRWPRRLRTVSGAGLAVVIGISAGTTAVESVAGPLTVPHAWSIAACDVGQGDALLVRSEGQVALIDTGPDPAPLQRCLTRLGVAHLDLLVLTHFDLDHAGGVGAVEGIVEVVLHGPTADGAQEGLVAALSRGGADARLAHAGMTGSLGAATWTVLWPPERSRAFPSGNQASVTLDVRGGGVPPAIFLGDLDATAQRALLHSGAPRPPYRVVKVAHHGSADQAPELYTALGATVAVISVGLQNDYGHPRAETIDFLERDGAVIARTDHEGLILVTATGAGVDVWRERSPPPHS